MDNNADNSGGGMHNTGSSNPIINECVFVHNTAGNAGGGLRNNSNTATITDCEFLDNYARWGGGGMYNYYASPTVTRCLFQDNVSDGYGGGGINNDQAPSRPVIVDCDFIENDAVSGGGIYNRNNTTPIIIGSRILRNDASNTGGGMYVNNSDPNLIDCIFLGNDSNDDAGGIYNYNNSTLKLRNCLFSGNSSNDKAGALYNRSGSHSELLNCTFNENSAPYGGGIYNWGTASADIANSIFWGNTASTAGPQIAVHNSSNVAIEYSCLQGGIPEVDIDGSSSATDNGNNRFDDPKFIDADGPDNQAGTEDDNLHLRPNSPCIDNGTNKVLPLNITDLDGRSRYLDGNCDGEVTVDMGVYEFTFAAFGSFDGDCDVDLCDFVIFSAAWLTQPEDSHWNPICDLALPTDKAVNLKDLALFCTYWLLGK